MGSCHHAIVAEWRNASPRSRLRPRVSLRHRLEGRPHRALTELALRAGFRGIDTANQRKHYFEAGVGQAPGRQLSRGRRHAGRAVPADQVHVPGGQDHRLPYDPAAALATQVAQSLASSLEHLGTDHVDSYVLHGPASGARLDRGRRRGVGRDGPRARRRPHATAGREQRVAARSWQQMALDGAETPAFVQNRCYAGRGWDRDVRAFCRERGIVYQGFSLLTANREVLHDDR